MLLTLGAAGATLLVMLAVIGIPALDACNGDSRGLLGCLRGIVNDRFDRGAELPPPQSPVVAVPGVPAEVKPPAAADAPAAAPVVVEQVADAPTPPSQVAAAPVVPPTRSLAPAADKPHAPALAPPQVAIVPALTPAIDAPVETAVLEQVDAAPAHETIAPAWVIEPAAPGFVPPAPAISFDGVPPDLRGGAVVVTASDPAPAFVLPATPNLPATPPPDLVAAVEAGDAVAGADAPELPAPVATAAPVVPLPEAVPAPDFALAFTPVLPTAPPPDLVAVVEGPATVETPPAVGTGVPPAVLPAAGFAPDFVLPTTPELPAAPPPDLTSAAIDPLVPEPPAQPEAQVLAPTIDAVEIDNTGDFIAGNGPAGATMRLYVDGVVAGVSPVEGGRWLVEGNGLLTEPTQTLKVEALDPVTGKVIGEAKVEFQRPAEPAAETPAAVETPTVAEPASAEPVAPAVLAAPEPEPEPAADQPQAAIDPPVAIAPPTVDATPPVVDTPEPLPALDPVVPSGESASVTILAPPAAPGDATLATGAPSSDAVITLRMPKTPAIMAQFTLPTAEVAADITVLRAVAIGDPGAGRFVSGKAIIRRGDTLWAIAHRYYGLGIRYRTIFRANREQIARPGRIYPGQVFDLPLVYDD